MIHLTTNAHLLKVTCDLLIVSHILTVKSYDPILSSTFELLYSICHAFSLKSLLFFDFTAYNFLIILFLKLGEIWGMTPLPECKNSCVLGLPKQKGKRRRADKEIQKGKKSPKDKGRARSVLSFFNWFPMPLAQPCVLDHYAEVRRREWRKEKKPWYYSRS